MQKRIQQLIPDIQGLLRTEGWFTDELAQSLARKLQFQLNRGEGREGRLRLSSLGPKCPRALWYSVHHPELAEPLPPGAKFKYQYGHIIEELALSLAKAAGHSVEGEQDEVCLDGVVGHLDAIVDGCILDVKSCSSHMFKDFERGNTASPFIQNYLCQLDGYIGACLADPRVTVKDRGYLLVIDKQLGRMCLYEHKFREAFIRQRVAECLRIAELGSPPKCTCGTTAEGASGNQQLDLVASYNPFKYCCFPNLRTFIYEKKPVYLTKVVREPSVPEVDRNGKLINV